MSKILPCLLVFCLCATGVYAQQDASVSPASPDPPDVSGWNRISTASISIRVSDFDVLYYIGYDLTFQNPKEPSEFVRQIRVFVPFVVVKSNKVQDKNFVDQAITYVTDGTEKLILEKYLTDSDPVIYFRWKEMPDEKRGTVQQNGIHEIWFWNSYGKWEYDRGVMVRRRALGEHFYELDNEYIVVGYKYTLNKSYFAREVPHAFLVVAAKYGKKGR